MTTGDDSYPSAWTPRGVPQAAPPETAIEPILPAIDAYLSALTPDQAISWSSG